ncbi:DUF2470 domain-containing protein [Sphaerisporangium corydalis]|uniref:DUF2470 domain-containing protein n=1 Tax=Sphaerisporangium corydalis TaxID=1441875 RepID=A0ABV9EAN0_9ACTN|nr:DUF2470 domain-containing protein [Sphaerisporangium corydalis]
MHVTVPPISERIRSLAIASFPTHVSLDGSAHRARGGVDATGRPLLLVKPGEPLHALPASDDVVVTVDLAASRTLGGVEHPRGLLKVQGWAQAVPAAEARDAAVAVAGRCPDESLFAAVEGDPAGPRLFRVDVGYVIYLTGQESGMLDAEEYLGAGPDPFLDAAERILHHVNESHRDQLRQAVRKMLGGPAPDVWLWELDRYGATVRSGIEDPTLIRVPWSAPVDGPEALERALACLICAH